MRLKRLIQESTVKLYAEPIFLHFAIASLVLAIIGTVGSILSEGLQHKKNNSLDCKNLLELT